MKSIYLIESGVPVVAMVEMENEIWRPIIKLEGIYEVSSLGRVRSLDRLLDCKSNKMVRFNGKMLSNFKNKGGYVRVMLSSKKDGYVKTRLVHQLVIESFWDLIPGCPNPQESLGLEPNHKDGVRDNNRISNLELVTKSENIKHSWVMRGGISKTKGEANGSSKLKESDIHELYAHISSGKSVLSFAKMKGLSQHAIRSVVMGDAWKHIKLDWAKVHKSKFNYGKQK